ncbi:MAG: hypothetical protein ABIO43_04190 [Sphingomicrobium sp.]
MDNVGEVWERNYRRRKLSILGLAALFSGLAPLVIKVAGDESVVFPFATVKSDWHLPLLPRIVIATLFLAGLALAARWNWVASDEVRRSHLLSFWAAIGMSVGITFFGFMFFGRDIPEAARLPLAFILPTAMGLLFAISRWLRDGFVW